MHFPSPTSRSGQRVYLSLWDLFWATASPMVALWLRDSDILFSADWTVVGLYWALASGFALMAFFALRIQDGMNRYFSAHSALDIAEAVLFAELMTTAALFTLTRLDGIPRSMPIMHGLLLATGVIAVRILIRVVFSEQNDANNHNRYRERIILIGANPLAAVFIQLLRACAPQRESVIAVLDNDGAMVGRAISGVQVLGAPHELDAIIGEFAIHGISINRVVVAGEVDTLNPTVLHQVERVCQRQKIKLCFLPRMIGLTERGPTEEPIDSVPRQAIPLSSPSLFYRSKRALDIIGSIALIVFLSPLMMIAGMLVMLDVGTPVLFWQERLGWKGRSFLIYKFRTLRAPFGPDGNPILGSRRPSAIGHFLRVTRIDELPQLLNVLLGDMSLIGPRPLLPEDQPSAASIRLSVRPGISGWAQVNGGKLVSKEDKDELDEWYIRNASLWVEARIVFRTIKLMLNNFLPSDEGKADTEQVQRKNIDLGRRIA
jgi:lipopolysaccharide/colanic/teichoic acid biosynthesis glycosyltransferase